MISQSTLFFCFLFLPSKSLFFSQFLLLSVSVISVTLSIASSNFSSRKAKNCGMAESRDERLNMLTGSAVELASPMDSVSRFYRVDENPIQEGFNCQRVTIRTVTQSSPSPILSCVAKTPKYDHVSLIPVTDLDSIQSEASKVLQDVHISARLMQDFLELARENTEKDLETCGVLGAFLENGTYYVTTLIIPQQESTSNSCEAIKEEEFFAIQNERSLCPVGWIHTHPSQSCFMSSIDLHTHYSYQVMIPEAFAIVMAPTDTSKSYGIFRLSDPGGMSILKECQEKGFHRHEEPADGSPIFEQCYNVYTNSNLRFEIFDLR